MGGEQTSSVDLYYLLHVLVYQGHIFTGQKPLIVNTSSR